MKITKNTMQESLDKALEIFSKNVIKPNCSVIIKYINDEDFIASAKDTQFNSMLINSKFYEDFDKEYKSFAAVYPMDKTQIIKLMGLPYRISISLDRAKRVLSKESTKNTKEYLLHVFFHELTHLFEDEIKDKYSECYDIISNKYNSENHINEMLAETFSYKYTDHVRCDEMEKRLNYKLYKRLNNQRINIVHHDDEKEMTEYMKYI